MYIFIFQSVAESNESQLQLIAANPAQTSQHIPQGMVLSQEARTLAGPHILPGLPMMNTQDPANTIGLSGQVLTGTASGTPGLQTTAVPDTASSNPGQKTVMLMLEPGMAPTPVQISLPTHGIPGVNTEQDTSLADAAESLQALAGAVAETLTSLPATAEEILESTQETNLSTDTIDIQALQNDEQLIISQHDLSDSNKSDSEVHLTPDQLMNLESGDYIEINGETYKVEFSMDEKQQTVNA